ncbi:uncharacterized protein LOC18422579 isoform X2 [Amborella trichopoda]|uniref:uncharacterized protein LOC18422579 isoform X2 n=1 Tax=Amborella trichopoda TaxID=13333 RepID=UPI0009BCB77F|nr:uncharacterized protein LOC18422579 isoform X2 [Amborella trichopoda]|eukprot:XP_020523434.1 uncharacterized protein LOC18422579 isoform X2 [Amborella trichopoda]
MSNGSSNGNGRENAIPAIPSSARKIVQSLKEIVNCPDNEIYAMLRECNMDPNDTVQRLLSQDTFHEVKSKREKKKEIKDTAEPRSRIVGSATNRGGRVGAADRGVGRAASTPYNSSESGGTRPKVSYKKENGTSSLSSFSVSGMAGSSISRRSTSPSDSLPMESWVQTASTSEASSASFQPSSRFQPAWTGAPGQVSMADIVKSGQNSHMSLPSTTLHQGLHAASDLSSDIPETVSHETSVPISHGDGWSILDQPLVNVSLISEVSANSVAYADQLSSPALHVEQGKLPASSHQLDELQVPEERLDIQTLAAKNSAPSSASNMQMALEDAGSAPHSEFFDDSLFRNSVSGHSRRLTVNDQEGGDDALHMPLPDYRLPSAAEDVNAAISSNAAKLQQLSLQKEEKGALPTEDNSALVIPDHLQVPSADFSHLSFGSFGSGISAAYSVTMTTKSPQDNSEDTPVSSSEQAEMRTSEYHGSEQLNSTSTENMGSRNVPGVGSYESTPISQADIMKHDAVDAAGQGHQYPFTSAPSYAFENASQVNAATYSYGHTNSQMQSLAPFSNVMQAHTSSSLGIQPERESDMPYSPFLLTQSMPTKYSTTLSSISGPISSVPELAKANAFRMPAQPSLQTLPSTSIPTMPQQQQQHLPSVHAFSQPTALPLGQFSNMLSYPYLPQSYAYLPSSAYQHAYAAGNTGFHQSPSAGQGAAGIKYSLPQYKNSVAVSSLPHSAAAAYGSFGTNPLGSFALNSSTTSSGSTTMGYDDIVSSQYKDGSHYVPIQQNESSAVWVHGPGSRNVSAIPANTYYSLQGHNQLGEFRQPQQASHYNTLGYPNFYHAQMGVAPPAAALEHQQSPSDGGSRAPSSHQIWAHGY